MSSRISQRIRRRRNQRRWANARSTTPALGAQAEAEAFPAGSCGAASLRSSQAGAHVGISWSLALADSPWIPGRRALVVIDQARMQNRVG